MINNIRKIIVLLMISAILFSYCGCSKPTSETHGEINSYSVSKSGELSPNNMVIQLDDLFTEPTEELNTTEEQETSTVISTDASVETDVSEPTDEIYTEPNEEVISSTTGEDDVLPTEETTQIVTDSSSPTNLPQATDSPKPTNKPVATSTPKPTNKPAATSTPKPTNKPAATSTPKPTNKPAATSTPKPTNKPAATSTPEPTNKPAATSTPKPTSKPKPPAETTKDTSKYGTCWISGTGKKYHSKSTCSGMTDPIQTSIGNAEDLGYTACKKCW